jgi:Asp-tRNA(Asn)/Glu-tRNA(Gln) amidotransferase A subunit family amidase
MPQSILLTSARQYVLFERTWKSSYGELQMVTNGARMVSVHLKIKLLVLRVIMRLMKNNACSRIRTSYRKEKWGKRNNENRHRRTYKQMDIDGYTDKWTDIDGYTDRQQGDLISLFLFF